MMEAVGIENLDYKWILAILASLISICNLIYYISTVLKGKTKPHMFTWLIWGLVTGVAAVTQFVSDAGAGTLLTALVALNCLTIACLGYFKGVKHITSSDVVCLAGCLIAIAIWPFVQTPLYSLLIVTAIDVAGYYPTIRKSYDFPHEENIFSFCLYGVTYTMSILALSHYTLLTTLYPASIALSSILLVLFLAARRYQLGYKIFA